MQNISVALIGAYPYNGNRGVGALTYSMLYLLSKISKNYKQQIKIFLINPEFGNKIYDSFTIDSENVDFINIEPINLFRINDLFKFILNPKKIRSLKEFIKVDFIMNIGAGDSFSDIYGVKRFNAFNDLNRMAMILNKSLVLLPQTIGPFNDDRIKNMAIKSIEKAQIVFARDKMSFDYVKENTNQKNIYEIIDVAFFMPFEKQKFSDKYIHVGLNVSALLWNGGYTRDNQFRLKSDYQTLIRSIIEYFVSLQDVKLHLVPHVVSANSSIENDYEVSFNLVNEYNNERIILAPFFLTPTLAKNYIAGMDFFMGARMHATIAAFSSGVPVFPMAYSRKFNGLFWDTLNYRFMGDMTENENYYVFDSIKNAFEKREQLVEIINERMNTIVKDRERIFLNTLAESLKLK